VDGSGKSSTIDYIQNLNFFQYTGVKRIYFGNNEYWIPGLEWILSKNINNKWIRLFFSTLGLIDRQLRILIALYYMRCGNLVLADRYMYDDEIGKEYHKNFLKKIYYKLFSVKMFIKPDKIIFLDVNPEIAYTRKQDYSYEKMLVVNQAYKEYMYKVEGVKIINADKAQSEVCQEVINLLLDLDKST
jgi:thymidylate kinase